MKQQEFMSLLKTELEKNGILNTADILSDYEEHFSHGLASGKTEEDVANALGNPEVIAKAYQTEKMIDAVIKNPHQSFRWGLAFKVILRLLILAPFNFFVLFIPGIVVGSLVFAAWAVSLALFSVGVGAFSFLPEVARFTDTLWAISAGVFAGFGFMGLGVIGAVIMLMVTKAVLMMVISYLQWNIKFVTEK